MSQKGIRDLFPEPVKSSYRLLRYGNQRKKFLREIAIRREQDAALRRDFDARAARLIVFLVPGADWATGRDIISGGAISIVSLAEHTAELHAQHPSQTIVCTMNRAHLFLKHESFPNDTPVFRFSQLSRHFRDLDHVLIHIPELMASDFLQWLSVRDLAWLRAVPSVHLNILCQNIRLMPLPDVVATMSRMAGHVTITTAHDRYCTSTNRARYGVPFHKLSVWISPEQYRFVAWEHKEDLLVVSPDDHPDKDGILRELRAIPGLAVQIIRDLSYVQFKDLISRAKWSLTFGEGLDGYLVEPVFSGAVGFAMYNDQFFTPDFADLRTVYPSVDVLRVRIAGDIADLNERSAYVAYQRAQFDLCSRYYSHERYVRNIEAFYRREYTHA